jgi:hypothetical protein
MQKATQLHKLDIQFLLFVSKTFVSIDNATLLQMKQAKAKLISILYNVCI